MNRSQIPSADHHSEALLEKLLQVARTSALEELASGFAHEINQPIGAITTFSQAAQRMLQRSDLASSPVAEVLGHIGNEALKAGQGVHRIRQLFSRQEPVKEPRRLPEVYDELLPVLKLLASRNQVPLEYRAEADLPLVAVDALRIQHVLFALVQNALEATPVGVAGVSVNIEVSGNRYEVLTSVSDDGHGMPESARTQLFHPFFTTKPAGTGLGLASSRAIVEALDGTIGCDHLERGTRFWFRLPAVAPGVS